MKLFNNTCDGIFDTVDIRFTKKCDNNCSFCIEKFSGVKGSKTDVDKILKSVKEVKAKEVLILGGEPFLEIDKLYDLVRQLKETKIYITTSLPKIIIEKWDVFCNIMGLVDGLNISIHHYDYKRNNEVLSSRDNYDRLHLVSNITQFFQPKVRACINLVKGNIDTNPELLKMLMKMDLLGVRSVKINELCHSTDYVSFEKVTGKKMRSPYTFGCYSRVFEKEFTNMNIELKRSCFITEQTLSATLPDLIKTILKSFIKPLVNGFCVIYESGKICKEWITK